MFRATYDWITMAYAANNDSSQCLRGIRVLVLYGHNETLQRWTNLRSGILCGLMLGEPRILQHVHQCSFASVIQTLQAHSICQQTQHSAWTMPETQGNEIIVAFESRTVGQVV